MQKSIFKNALLVFILATGFSSASWGASTPTVKTKIPTNAASCSNDQTPCGSICCDSSTQTCGDGTCHDNKSVKGSGVDLKKVLKK